MKYMNQTGGMGPGSWHGSLALAVMTLALWAWAFSPCSAQTAVAPSIGDGKTTDTAYQLTSLNHLVWLHDQASAQATNGVYYKLMNDIDASSTAIWNDDGTNQAILEGFKPIGNDYSFNGIFLGQGHTISGLVVNRPYEQFAGLFGVLGFIDYSSDPYGQPYPLARIQDLTIKNCSIYGARNVGGLLGNNVGTVLNCTVDGGTVTSRINFGGGAIGSNDHGIITNCHAAVTVQGNTVVGGLVGGTFKGSLTACEASGTVTAAGSQIGGLVGMSSYSTLKNCSARGKVVGGEAAGGLAGWVDKSNLDQCSASGSVSGSVSDVQQTEFGGLAGLCNNSTVTRCQASGAVAGKQFVGGLFGHIINDKVDQTYATGAVAGSGDQAGGLIGSMEASTVSQSYATGTVTGINKVGGLAGGKVGSALKNSFAVGAVNGSSKVGSLIGYNESNLYLGNGVFENVINCYAAGAVRGTESVGGLIGYMLEGFTVDNCYYDVDTTGQSSSRGGTGLTTAQMLLLYDLTHDTWDYTTIWAVNGAYPYLRVLPARTVTFQAGAHGHLSDGLGHALVNPETQLEFNQTMNFASTGTPIWAVPETSYHFTGWSDGSVVNPRTVANLVADTTLTAQFAANTAPVVASAAAQTSNTTPLWTWTSGGGLGQYRYQFNTTTGTWSETTHTAYTASPALADGTYTLYVQELQYSDVWSATGSFVVTVDTVVPAAPVVTVALTISRRPTWSWTGHETSGGSFSYRLDQSGPWELTSATSYTPSAALSTGDHTLAVRERDAAGNWSTATEKTIAVTNAVSEWADYQ